MLKWPVPYPHGGEETSVADKANDDEFPCEHDQEDGGEAISWEELPIDEWC